MRTHGRNRRFALLLMLMATPLSKLAYPSCEGNGVKVYRDISAIGHRVIGHRCGCDNWYSLDKEKEMGSQVSAAFEKSTPLLRDSVTHTYLDRLAQKIVGNSDSQLPVTIEVVDTEDSYAVTLPGGHQYVSRGLLLQLQNEGELAAAIARGIAHTALRSATGEATRAHLAGLVMNSAVFAEQGKPTHGTDAALGVPLAILSFRRKDEVSADYFGVQYLYKSGYNPACFIGFMQKAWPASGRTAAVFGPFPPLPERLKAVEREIGEILPKQPRAVASTEEFEAFRAHLLSLPPPQPTPKLPTLRRSDRQEID